MAKLIRHDYSGIHDALNRMIIAEVKAALELLPGKKIEADGPASLCHIIVSLVSDYQPEDLSVRSVFLREDGTLSFIASVPDSSNEWHANEDDTDWLDITDFGYLIEQIAQKVEGDRTVNVANKSFEKNHYVVAEFTLRTAAMKTVTV